MLGKGGLLLWGWAAADPLLLLQMDGEGLLNDELPNCWECPKCYQGDDTEKGQVRGCAVAGQDLWPPSLPLHAVRDVFNQHGLGVGGRGPAVTCENHGGAAPGGLGTSCCNAILRYSTVRDAGLSGTEWTQPSMSKGTPFEKGLGKCLLLVWVNSGPCGT